MRINRIIVHAEAPSDAAIMSGTTGGVEIFPATIEVSAADGRISSAIEVIGCKVKKDGTPSKTRAGVYLYSWGEYPKTWPAWVTEIAEEVTALSMTE